MTFPHLHSILKPAPFPQVISSAIQIQHANKVGNALKWLSSLDLFPRREFTADGIVRTPSASRAQFPAT